MYQDRRELELARPPDLHSFGVGAHPRSIGFASGLHWRRTPTLSQLGRKELGAGKRATTALHSDRPSLSLPRSASQPAHCLQGHQAKAAARRLD